MFTICLSSREDCIDLGGGDLQDYRGVICRIDVGGGGICKINVGGGGDPQDSHEALIHPFVY